MTAPPASESAAPEVPSAPVADDNTLRVYSSADSDVEPPQMLYPSLPPAISNSADVNVMEVFVSERGQVERVRLVSMARRMTDMMLLSGAKTWRFAPASRDGQPVRYRMVVSWSATP